ncbi:hypothetical protein BC832DRAFT_397495 [Gaertneriomyces semiglobifer]|nr:hypothetical protein BC832DRAFT_397495 [Gaertneriomyces semiglobifer]
MLVTFPVVVALMASTVLASGKGGSACIQKAGDERNKGMESCKNDSKVFGNEAAAWERVCRQGVESIYSYAVKECGASVKNLVGLKAVSYNAMFLARRDGKQCWQVPSSGATFCPDAAFAYQIGKAIENLGPCNSSTHGKQKCLPDGRSFVTCVYDKWTIAQTCGSGTKCKPYPTDPHNHVQCGW